MNDDSMSKNGSGEAESRKRLSWVQWCWFVTACVLLSAAILTFTANDLVNVSPVLGASMLLAGCVNILIYHKNQGRLHGSHWLIADGMSTALLSLFLLFNQMIQSAMIPFFLGVWELFTGVLKTIDAKELKSSRIRGWSWFCGIGAIEVLSGIAALLKPIEDFVGMNIVAGAVLVVQGIGYVFKVLIYPRISDE